jgi:hypothetical protein
MAKSAGVLPQLLPQTLRGRGDLDPLSFHDFGGPDASGISIIFDRTSTADSTRASSAPAAIATSAARTSGRSSAGRNAFRMHLTAGHLLSLSTFCSVSDSRDGNTVPPVANPPLRR